MKIDFTAYYVSLYVVFYVFKVIWKVQIATQKFIRVN